MNSSDTDVRFSREIPEIFENVADSQSRSSALWPGIVQKGVVSWQLRLENCTICQPKGLKIT